MSSNQTKNRVFTDPAFSLVCTVRNPLEEAPETEREPVKSTFFLGYYWRATRQAISETRDPFPFGPTGN